MAYEFALPDIGEGLTEATILQWFVKVGDHIEVDAPMVEAIADGAAEHRMLQIAATNLDLGIGRIFDFGHDSIEASDSGSFDRLHSILPIATCAAASPQQIAWSAVQRLAIVNDPAWNGGDYYDAPDGKGPWAGLSLAREISQITYRTTEVFDDRFGREHFNRRDEFEQWGRYQVESYLDHHGQKLVRRFDANSFLVLSKAMDLHDLGRGRGGVAAALAQAVPDPASEIPMIGASGAVSGILGAYMLLYPRAHVLVLVPLAAPLLS